jgi:hypothetical protein
MDILHTSRAFAWCNQLISAYLPLQADSAFVMMLSFDVIIGVKNIWILFLKIISFWHTYALSSTRANS